MSLKYVLLTLLNREARSGYELVRTFDTAVGFFWNASHQQVYRELGVLSEAKLVKFKKIKQDEKPDKKIYSLSRSGKEALHIWLESPIKETKTKNLLLVKLLNTSARNVELMQQELQRNKRRSKEIQRTYCEIEKMFYSSKKRRLLPENEVMVYAALRKGILSIDAHLVWLSEVEVLLSDTFE